MPGTDASTVLVAQGADLSEIEAATGTVRRTVTVEGGSELGVDSAHGAAWMAGPSGAVLQRVDTAAFKVTATAELPADFVTFVEPDPATGNVWVGSGTSVLVFDKNAGLLTTLTGQDRPTALTFDRTTGRAFLLREDTSDGTTDNTGALEIIDSATFAQAATPVPTAGQPHRRLRGRRRHPGRHLRLRHEPGGERDRQARPPRVPQGHPVPHRPDCGPR